VIAWLPVRSFEAKSCSVSQGFREADGARSWRTPAASSLDAVQCEPVPERAGDLYAAVKLARQQRGLPLDENDLWVAATALALGATLVSRNDFGGIDGLAVVALGRPLGKAPQGRRPRCRRVQVSRRSGAVGVRTAHGGGGCL
jgi:hypothetical protein